MRQIIHAKPYPNVLSTVGNTPLVRLQKVASAVQSEIYAKLEYFNPAGSVKDRIGLTIIDSAEKSGALKPGGTIVEATSGNTGMGLAMVAAVKGYRTICVMPDKVSHEKVRNLEAFGAKVVLAPTNVSPEDPNSYYKVAERLVRETPNSFYANQYHNPDNPRAHYETTGPEIWEQMERRVDAFVAGMGTGGTISGTGQFLKEKNPAIKIVGVDPIGSIYYDYFKTGKMPHPRQYDIEGIGEDFLPSTMNLKILDEIVQVDDQSSFTMTRNLLRWEGIFAGGSSGTAVYGAIEYAKKLRKPQRIVVLIPDSGDRYLSKVYDDEWLKSKGYKI
ncbi:MAG: cysteine synthase family protein [Deltaproteobacteria bacterium]|nr:cysteine synthase family protein [Deltaproteobacteria bacterium]